MYSDIITNIKILGIYVLLNGKEELYYDIIFESVYNIITQNNSYSLEYDLIVRDSKRSLVNVVAKYCPNTIRISCLFHFKQDLISKIREYGLYKKEDRNLSNEIIEQLCRLTTYYKGDISS